MTVKTRALRLGMNTSNVQLPLSKRANVTLAEPFRSRVSLPILAQEVRHG